MRALESALREEIEPLLPVAAATVDGLGLAHWLPSHALSRLTFQRARDSPGLAQFSDGIFPPLHQLPPAWQDADPLALLATLLLRLAGWVALRAWWLFGLSYGRLRYAACVFNIAVVGGRYALTDRIHHVPTSPLKLALMLRAVLTSALELVPLAPVLAARLAANILLGRPLLDALNATSVVGALWRPRRFARNVALRRRCDRAASFDDYLAARRELDQLEGGDAWWAAASSPHFDERLVSSATAALLHARDAARARGDPSELADLVLALANRAFGGINNPHNYARVGMGSGTHAVLEALIDEIEASVHELIGTEWEQEKEEVASTSVNGGGGGGGGDGSGENGGDRAGARDGEGENGDGGGAGNGGGESGVGGGGESTGDGSSAPAHAPPGTAVRFGEAAKRAWVRAALHAHGCTALCLSGGGAVALYHLGVVKELHEHGLLPRVISGTSGGSIVAAMLACHTDVELPE